MDICSTSSGPIRYSVGSISEPPGAFIACAWAETASDRAERRETAPTVHERFITTPS
jgi:hypothetical protein